MTHAHKTFRQQWHDIMRDRDEKLTFFGIAYIFAAFIVCLILMVLSVKNFMHTPHFTYTDGLLRFDGLSVKDGLYSFGYGTLSRCTYRSIPFEVRRRMRHPKFKVPFKKLVFKH